MQEVRVLLNLFLNYNTVWKVELGFALVDKKMKTYDIVCTNGWQHYRKCNEFLRGFFLKNVLYVPCKKHRKSCE